MSARFGTREGWLIAAVEDPSCNFCGKPTTLDGHGRYVEHQGITTRGICCGTALLHVPGRKVARR